MSEIKPEFSRPISADQISGREVREQLTASPAEREALARRLGLREIGSLTALVRLRRVRGGQMIRITGDLQADVVQTCVVSLEPLPAHVEERFQALFAPAHLLPKEPEELAYDTDDSEDPPEVIENGRIDIGELVAQHLSLALDPYPRLPGLTFSHIEDLGEDGIIPDAPNELPPDFADFPEIQAGSAAAAPVSPVPGGGTAGGEGRPNPFAVLANIKPKP